MNNKNNISRRKFIKTMIGGGLILAGGNMFSGCFDKTESVPDKVEPELPEKTADLDIEYLRQIVTKDTLNSRCIMWQSEAVMTSPTLEVRLHDAKDIQTVAAIDRTFTDDGQTNYQYTAIIDNLSANTEYEYRIAEGDHCTEWHNFKTGNGTNFKMLVFPDSQSADYDFWSELANNAYKRNSDAELFTNVGDIVDNGEDRFQWHAWMDGVDDLLEDMPFAPVMGNHETYNRQWQVRQPEAYLKYFDVPDNGNEKFNHRYYSFDYGNAHFIVLDTQWDELNEVSDGDGQNLINEQKNWLRQDVQSSNKKWKIVLMHKDVLQYRIPGRPDRREGFSNMGVEFMPLFDELKIDIVFTAHLHTYRDRGHIYNFEHNPQGPLYILTGVAGDVRYPGLWIKHALDEVIAPQPDTNNYLTMEVTDNAIDVKCFLPDGTEIDHVTVN